ncbi:hypothetical protein FRC08_013915, partial [Ceratobasidium sp. 394]
MSSSSTRHVFDATFLPKNWYDESLSKILSSYAQKNKSTLPYDLYLVLYDAAAGVFCHES